MSKSKVVDKMPVDRGTGLCRVNHTEHAKAWDSLGCVGPLQLAEA